MDIERINRVLGTAIVGLQEGEVEGLFEGMTDSDVLNAVKKIKSLYKRRMTVAQRKLDKKKKEAFSRFGSSDVEQSARTNAIRRAEMEHEKAIGDAEQAKKKALDSLRIKAGQWADIVSG